MFALKVKKNKIKHCSLKKMQILLLVLYPKLHKGIFLVILVKLKTTKISISC